MTLCGEDYNPWRTLLRSAENKIAEQQKRITTLEAMLHGCLPDHTIVWEDDDGYCANNCKRCKIDAALGGGPSKYPHIKAGYCTCTIEDWRDILDGLVCPVCDKKVRK